MLTGALTTSETIGDNCEKIYGNLNVEDAQFVTDQIITDEDILRYETDFNLILERQNYTDITEGDNTIRLFRESSKVNLAWIFETGDGEVHDVVPSTAPDGNVYICKKYGDVNGLHTGDVLILGNQTLTVGGYALRPDYLNTLKDLTETIGDYSHFTTAIVNDETYEAVLNSDPSLTDAKVTKTCSSA